MTTVVVQKDDSIFVTRRECNLHPLGFSQKKKKENIQRYSPDSQLQRALEDNNNMVTEER